MWPWSKPDPPKSEGTRAREQAEENLVEVRQQREEVTRVSESLQAHRMRNHFGDNLIALIEQGRYTS
jgi:uncharacterized protein YabN with tetrapyrrole methylase and pyrophosphatase domain